MRNASVGTRSMATAVHEPHHLSSLSLYVCVCVVVLLRNARVGSMATMRVHGRSRRGGDLILVLILVLGSFCCRGGRVIGQH